jgi:branched-chain amino acid transport system permease protein
MAMVSNSYPRDRIASKLLLSIGLTAIAAIAAAWYANLYVLTILTLICIFGGVALCWNLVIGVANVWSFAQLALFGIGGYANTMLIVKLGVSPELAIFAGPFAALVVGVAIAVPCARLRGIYVVLFTLALSEIMRLMITTDQSGFTGGTFGLRSGDVFGLSAYGQLATTRVFFLTAAVIATITALVIWLVLKSPSGLAFRALADTEAYATARGINRRLYQIVVFGISAFLTGLLGAFYSDYVGDVSPSFISFDQQGLLLAMIVIGGWGSAVGPMLGAFVVMGLSEWLRQFENYQLLILGCVMIGMIVGLPGGLAALFARRGSDAPLLRRWRSLTFLRGRRLLREEGAPRDH